jgi:hypothetical protein
MRHYTAVDTQPGAVCIATTFCEVVPRRYRTCHVTVAIISCHDAPCSASIGGVTIPCMQVYPKADVSTSEETYVHTCLHNTKMYIYQDRSEALPRVWSRDGQICGSPIMRWWFLFGEDLCIVEVRVGGQMCAMLAGEVVAFSRVLTGRCEGSQ